MAVVRRVYCNFRESPFFLGKLRVPKLSSVHGSLRSARVCLSSIGSGRLEDGVAGDVVTLPPYAPRTGEAQETKRARLLYQSRCVCFGACVCML